MSISIVNVTVPATGDGPVASIASLVGEKTVELSGRFTGRYILLGAQNSLNFVPVAVFDANGEESIKVTLALALSDVRVRSEAVNSSGVTMNVSGVLGAGLNQFATIATIAPGSSGAQAIIDLNIALPPNNVEQDLCFLCDGNFQGLLVVEGSLDGTHFNPIGSGFRADAQPPSLLGTSAPLEFSPLSTRDLVRYVRATMDGVVTSTVTLTFGGTNPGGGGSSGTPMPVFTTASGVTTQATGVIFTPPFSDGSIVASDSTTMGPGCDNSVVIGSFLTLDPGSSICTLIGTGNTVSSGSIVEIGVGLNASSPNCVNLGFGNTIGTGSGSSAIIGAGNNINNSSNGNCFMLGVGNTTSSQDTLAAGTGNNLDTNTIQSQAIGFGNQVSINALQSTLLGGGNRTTSSQTTCIGQNNVSNGLQNITLVGQSNNTGTGSQLVASFGYQITLANNATRCSSLGFNLNLTGSGTPTQVAMVGSNLTVNSLGKVVLIGCLSSVSAPTFDSIVSIGTALVTSQGSAVNIGSSNTILVGAELPIVIGGNITSSENMGGGGAVVQIGQNLAYGAVTAGVARSVHIGFNAHFGLSCVDNIFIGSNVFFAPDINFGDAAKRNTILGRPTIANTLSTDSSDNILLGDGTLRGAGSIAIGINNDAGNLGIAIGIATVGLYGIGLGQNVTTNSDAVGASSIALGVKSSAASHEFIVGANTPLTAPGSNIQLINVFAVKGAAPGELVALDTIRAITSPVAGSTGLSIVYNAAGTYSNKTVKAAVAPPGGSLLLYVDP